MGLGPPPIEKAQIFRLSSVPVGLPTTGLAGLFSPLELLENCLKAADVSKKHVQELVSTNLIIKLWYDESSGLILGLKLCSFNVFSL